MISPGLANTLNPILWGFNFIFASAIASGVAGIITLLRKKGIMKRQYQNNYLLNRISGLAFDVMIIAGIASIDFSDISKLWIPFLITILAGTVGTYFWLKFMTNKIYKGYEAEGFLSMFGMLTGTISSGVLLVREIDPEYKTPAANNLVTGSGTAIIFGAPLLVLIGLVIALVLTFTFMPDFFPASGILLAMGFGQGPGQANNVGSTYEALG
ncbi:MAG: hypothetical protein II232_02080, partial [Spirochaetaceae bacterium]|nr:hypothetical protein [Spirochaetaceae bacterium]